MKINDLANFRLFSIYIGSINIEKTKNELKIFLAVVMVFAISAIISQ